MVPNFRKPAPSAEGAGSNYGAWLAPTRTLTLRMCSGGGLSLWPSPSAIGRDPTLHLDLDGFSDFDRSGLEDRAALRHRDRGVDVVGVDQRIAGDRIGATVFDGPAGLPGSTSAGPSPLIHSPQAAISAARASSVSGILPPWYAKMNFGMG
jgi:hypothetical protein